MICANPDCRTTEMKPDFIKIINGNKVIYYCSNKCYSKYHKAGYKFKYGKENILSINWGKINMGGF